MWHGCRFLFLFFLVFRVVKINFKNKKELEEMMTLDIKNMKKPSIVSENFEKKN
jgi:hypothetical protein